MSLNRPWVWPQHARPSHTHRNNSHSVSNRRQVPRGSDIYEQVLDDLRHSARPPSSPSSLLSATHSASPALSSPSTRYSVTANAELYQPSGESDGRRGQGRGGRDVGNDLDPLRPSSAASSSSVSQGGGDPGSFERRYGSEENRAKKRCALCSGPGERCRSSLQAAGGRDTGAGFLEDSASPEDLSQDARRRSADRKNRYACSACRGGTGYGQAMHRRGEQCNNNNNNNNDDDVDDYFEQQQEDGGDFADDESPTASTASSPCLQICDFVSTLKLDALSRAGPDSSNQSSSNGSGTRNQAAMGHAPSLLHQKAHSKAYLAADTGSHHHHRGRSLTSPSKRPSGSAASTRSLYRDRAKDAAAAAATDSVDVLRFSLGHQHYSLHPHPHHHQQHRHPQASNGGTNSGRTSSTSVTGGPAAAPGRVVSWSASSSGGRGQSKFFTNSDELSDSQGSRAHHEPPPRAYQTGGGSGAKQCPASFTARGRGSGGGVAWEDDAGIGEDNAGCADSSPLHSYTPSRPGDRTRGDAVHEAEEAERGGRTSSNNNHNNCSSATEVRLRMDHLLPPGRTDSFSSSSSSTSLQHGQLDLGSRPTCSPSYFPSASRLSRQPSPSSSSETLQHSPVSFREHSASPDTHRPASCRGHHSSPTPANHHVRICAYNYDGGTLRKPKSSETKVSNGGDDFLMLGDDFRPRSSSDISMHVRRRRQLPRTPHSLYGKTAEEDEEEHARVHWADEERGSPLATSVLLTSIRPRALSHGSAELPRKPILKKRLGF